MNQSNQSDDTNQSSLSDNKNQSGQDGNSPKSHDERLFERLAGEMLVEVPDSLYQDCMFGLVFYKTSVSTCNENFFLDPSKSKKKFIRRWARLCSFG